MSSINLLPKRLLLAQCVIEAENLEEAIGKLKITTMGNTKDILTPSAEIILEPNAVNENDEAETHVFLITPTSPPPAQHVSRIDRSMAAGDDSIKLNVYSEFYEATGKTYKVTGDSNALMLSDPNIEVGGAD